MWVKSVRIASKTFSFSFRHICIKSKNFLEITANFTEQTSNIKYVVGKNQNQPVALLNPYSFYWYPDSAFILIALRISIGIPFNIDMV